MTLTQISPRNAGATPWPSRAPRRTVDLWSRLLVVQRLQQLNARLLITASKAAQWNLFHRWRGRNNGRPAPRFTPLATTLKRKRFRCRLPLHRGRRRAWTCGCARPPLRASRRSDRTKRERRFPADCGAATRRSPEPPSAGSRSSKRWRVRPHWEQRHPQARFRPSPAAAAEYRSRTRGSRCRLALRANRAGSVPSGSSTRQGRFRQESRRERSQELHVTWQCEEALPGIDYQCLAGDAARTDQIAQRADDVGRLDPAPQRIF